ILEVDVPMHAAAERLVLRVSAATERVVLGGGALGAGDGCPALVGQRDRAGDPIRPVPAHFDGCLARSVPAGLSAPLDSVDRIAQRAGRAIAHGADDVVHAAPAGGHEGTFGVEDRVQTVGAEAGVLADAAVVEDGQLHAVVSIAPVGNPLGVLL